MTTLPNNKHLLPENIDVVILCGGEGKRLKPILNDRPKPMARINDLPFLDILMDYVSGFGFKRFILCIGYKAEFITKYYQGKQTNYSVLFSREDKPMGTGGAMANAYSLIQSDIILGMNGDSFIKADLNKFIRFHKSKNSAASIVLTEINEAGQYGMIKLDINGCILSFSEKVEFKGTSLVNAGIYLINKSLLCQIPSNRKYSLEYEFFPRILDHNIYGYVIKKDLIDIGTPERYERANIYLKNYS